jgi:cytochrome c oxidase assembly factor CtaG
MLILDFGPVPSLLTSWSFEPLQIIPTAVVALLYARRVRTLRQAGTPVSRWRVWSFGTGLFLVLIALVSPVDAFGEDQFLFFHMIQHILLGDLAPLAFVAGLTGPILRPVLSLPGVWRLRFLTHPLVALPLWALDLYLWHIPFLYEGALRHSAVHALEHFCFFSFGALMWAAVLETLPAPEWFGTGAKLGYVAGVRVLETVLGNIFIWAGTVFYPFYEHPVDRWGISALADQQIAGAVMMIEGSIVTIAALAWLFLRMAAESELRQQLIERGMDERAVKRAVRYGRASGLAPEQDLFVSR